MENLIYKWQFSDKKERWKLWYLIIISIAFWIIIWWILTKQYWLSFISMLVLWLSFFVENNSPDFIEVNITELGIKVWEIFYEFWKIETYSFIYSWENAILLRLNLRKKWLKVLDLKIDNNIFLDLKEILASFIEENPDWKLSTSEKLINFLKL